ncbi:MAG TPA: globin-coupled sensor protein [Blastocatellia bacterium]
MRLTDKFRIDSREQGQRKNYIKFTEEDIALLQEMQGVMEQSVDKVVEDFYAHMLTYTETRAFFRDQETLNRVKTFQKDYLLGLCRGRYDEDYFERRLQIGVVHERINLVPKWYIGSYSNFTGLLLPLIAKRYRSKPKKMIRAIMALIKIMNLDQQLVIDTYIGSLIEKVSMVEQLEKARDEIGKAIDSMSMLANDILSSTTQLASTAQQTAAAVSEASTTVEEVKHTAQISSQKASNVSDGAQRTMQVSHNGKEAVDESIDGLNRIRDQVESIAESVVRLSEQSHAIAEIIATVNDLAEQSNLLSVNAAIEAAKAGDQGKGFAVVAQEVKRLAEQSKQATSQVRTILSGIQKAVSDAVMATERASKAVEAGVKQSTDAGEAIARLTESIAESAQAATQIAVSSQQQSVGMDQVAIAMGSIRQASAQNVASAQQGESIARDLHELGEKLKQLVAQFKL